jgi:hypothetical protein
MSERKDPTEILVRGTSYPRLRYCDVRGGWSGPGDFDREPLFARRGNWVSASAANVVLGPERAEAVWAMGDYHLQSRAGRWDPQAQGWVQDAVSSPCIDAGDPNLDASAERMPNGGRINMGAFGGTPEASLSQGERPYGTDADPNEIIDYGPLSQTLPSGTRTACLSNWLGQAFSTARWM